MTQNDIVQKLWNLCDVLRDDGINYSDYVTELVLLLFIKMEQENADNGVLQAHKLPEFARWKTLLGLSGLNLLHHYRSALLQLSQSTDPLIAAIYADAQTRLKEARHLEQLIKSLEGIDWFSAAKDGLGDLYEGLLEKNASETKSGAGQYFTPRPLIDSIVHLMQPQPGETIQDPAAGTAGFLIAADRYMREHTDDYFDLNERERAFQRNRAFLGMELVSGTRRLALMNCLLHGMEGDDAGVVHLGNTLGGAGAGLPKSDIILSNPPFGTAKGGGGPTRDDLTYQTSNKQLAFVQHIVRHLKDDGRAAVVLPDNVLFEGGAGETIRRELLKQADVHTLLRLPTGIFYAQGVKANVLFFDRKPAQQKPWTTKLWIYDLRTNLHFTLKENTLKRSDLDDFVNCYHPKNRHDRKESDRFKCFPYDELLKRDKVNLDIFWLKDEALEESANLPAPEIIAQEITADLEAALEQFSTIAEDLKG